MPDHPTAHVSAAYSLGLFFIVLVALIWTASSILVQYLYSEDVSFDSPFLLTYIGVSLFSLWLPTHSLLSAWALQDRHTSIGVMEMSSSSHARQSYAVVHTDGSVSSQDSTENIRDELEAGETSPTSRVISVWTVADHQHAARQIAPVWFLANWAYNASLAYTSITSSTVLASTGSLFTFLFAVSCQDETFNWVKCSGVLLGVTGSILTALEDRKNSDDKANDMGRSSTVVWGDALGLLSAVGYGAYAVQTRILCPHDERRYSMQVLLGYIGLYNMVVLSPIAIYELFSSQSSLSMSVLGFVVLKGLFDNVLSDYLWLRAIMLTSATVATVGLGLTIPLAFASDILLQRSDVLTAGSIMGALAVLGGFVLVNVGRKEETSNGSGHHNDAFRLEHEPRSTFRDSEAVAETADE
ncbi:solute carrier family 35, member F5 [Fistulifera solaris]|uniref:Solute carrier family 35, member F5 n=1 Tax=Fistulifera solaris TaxID=1519565 RepID=A0A1Z5JF87_FISSO|nr:solute carrier family 35, member F5 [Fistulifera solaris]|eukprot:GAX12674.1 solute carrier family 35, member F5 [Fistulifera solaris]